MPLDNKNQDLDRLFRKISERKYAISSNLPDSDKLKKEQEIREHTIDNDAKEATASLRVIMCYWVMVLVTIYLVVIAWIVLHIETLSDSVLITILTTTTINVIGLPLMIIRSIFPREDKNNTKVFRL